LCSTGACEDGTVSLCEMIAYGCAWMRGCNDDIGGMTRAAYIWHNGECYCWDTNSDVWNPAACGSGICCDAGRPATDVTAATGGGLASVTISLLEESGEWLLTVELGPDPGVSASAVELVVPKRWSVGAVNDGGEHDATFGKIKWGPFLDDTARTLTATLRGPAPRTVTFERASRLRQGSRSDAQLMKLFRGTASFDGVNQPIVVEE
jgi:hypothetical protein